MTRSEELKIRLKYLDQHIEYIEKELIGHKAYRDKIQYELNQARRLEREELQK